MRSCVSLFVVLFAALVASVAVEWRQPARPALAANVTEVAAGFAHSCALGDGTVECWGANDSGQLGDGTVSGRSTPAAVLQAPGGSPLSGVAAIDAGERHTCAVTIAGGLKCWGNNEWGQLGDGTITNRATPVDVCATAACTSPLTGVVAVATGGLHTCALTSTGGVKCWGLNSTGLLGDGSIVSSDTPVDVLGLTSGVTAIAAESFLIWGHTCAVTTAGGVKCWGTNEDGELGNGSTLGSGTPVDVLVLPGGSPLTGVAGVTVGSRHSCAAMVAGGVKCWGSNNNGRLGDGLTCATPCTTPVNVSGLGGVAAVSAGSLHTCARMTAGGLACWGANARGQLGDGTTTDRSTPVNVTGLSGDVTAVTGGGHHTCAVIEGGNVACWGWNQDGQLGDSTTTDRSTPVDVVGLEEKSAPNDAIGGIAELPGVAEVSERADTASGPSAALNIGIAAALGCIALAGLGWYMRRRMYH